MTEQLPFKAEADALVKGLPAEWSEAQRCFRVFGTDPSATPAEGETGTAIAVAEVAAQSARVSVRIRQGVKVGKPFEPTKGGKWGASVVLTDANRAAVRKVLEGLKPVTRAPRKVKAKVTKAVKPKAEKKEPGTKARLDAARKAATGPMKVIQLTAEQMAAREAKGDPLAAPQAA